MNANRNGQFALAAALAAMLAAFSCAEPALAPAVLSFSFRAADNAAAGLSSDVTADIDEALGVITVRLPASVADFSSLEATVALSDGGRAVPAVPGDYSTNPTALVIANGSGEQRVYLVDVGTSIPPAAATALGFSEYYAGTGYGYKDSLNRWIELTNRSASAIDLSQYRLVKRARVDGARAPELDVTVPLRGTLAAGASLVLYANRLGSAFAAVKALAGPDIAASDLAYNGIVDFDGDDGYQLVRDGIVLDILGPNGGTGADYHWGREKRMLKKAGYGPTADWDDKDWVAYVLANGAADAVNAGAPTATFANTNTNLTYFALEDLDPRAYGVIDTALGTVTLNVQEGTDVSALRPHFSTEGKGVLYLGTRIYSGESTMDLRTPKVITVVSPDQLSTKAYTVTVTFFHVLQFVTTNYDFSGNVQAAYDAIMAFGPDNATFYNGTLGGMTLTGVITAKDIYMSSSYKKSFFIQDNGRGILVLSDTSVAHPMGAKVSFTATDATKYFGLPEIKTIAGLTRVDALVHDIYYKTGPYDSSDAVGDVYMWEGIISQGMDNFSVGNFAGSLWFHSDRYASFAGMLAEGKRGRFFGPVGFSYELFRLEIGGEIQIQLR